MRYATWMVVTAVLFAIHGTGRAAQEIELKWNEVARGVAGRTVQMVLPDGTSLKGPVLNVTSEALEIEIKKTSNRKAYPKGRFSVPRSSVSVLRIKEVKGLLEGNRDDHWGGGYGCLDAPFCRHRPT